MSKLPQLVIKKNSPYRLSGGYLITDVNPWQKEEHTFTGEDGKTYKLYKPLDSLNNELETRPDIGTIAAGYGDVCFQAGQRVIVETHAFGNYNEGFKLAPFWQDEEGKEYYRVLNYDILFAIDESNGLIPRKYILLCEAIEEKAYDTVLELPDELHFKRRDVVRVVKTWEGCTEYEPGDLIMIAKDADYPVKWQGKEYLKVDTVGDFEVFAKVGNTKWKKTEVYKHHKR